MNAKFSPLPLETRNPFAFKYFVPHSGAIEAYSALLHNANDLIDKYKNTGASEFSIFFLSGALGSGKSHLAHAICDYMVERGLPRKCAEVFELDSSLIGSNASRFIDQYESMRAKQGMLIVCSAEPVTSYAQDPHIYSRLMSAWPITLYFPQEAEFQSVIQSLLERRNMLLSDHAIAYLVRRLPLMPSCFSAIVNELDDLALSEGKAPGERLLRQIVNDA
ncbi:MAG: hypothetical protein IT292_00485 [Deltaproteobacteria bacterium]|nr:hypothetical protein [Deltaproteobacteria bacterium]